MKNKYMAICLIVQMSLLLCQCESDTQTGEYKTENVEKSQSYTESVSIKDAVINGENDEAGYETRENADSFESKTETIYYNSDGTVSSHFIIKNKLDKDGNIVYSESENVLTDPGLLQKTWTTYDDQGNVKAVKQLNASGLGDTQEYKYDDYGNVLELYMNGELSEYHEYKYDEQNRVVEDICNLVTDYYNDSKDWAYTIFYTYDDSGSISKEVMYNARNDVETTYTYDYSDFENSGTYTETVTYSDETPGQITTYNKDGNIIKYDSANVSQTFEYNDHGDMQKSQTTTIYTDENGKEAQKTTITQYVNEYDLSERIESIKAYSNGTLDSEYYILY